jgi:hypothetical protein
LVEVAAADPHVHHFQQHILFPDHGPGDLPDFDGALHRGIIDYGSIFHNSGGFKSGGFKIIIGGGCPEEPIRGQRRY